MPRMELKDEKGRYEVVIPEEPDTRKLRILRDRLDLGIRDCEPPSDGCDDREKEEGAMRYRKKPLEIEAWRYGEEATPEWGMSRSRAAFCAWPRTARRRRARSKGR